MKTFMKPALMLGIAGALALGSVTASQARGFHHRGAAIGAAAGFAVGAAVGAAAASNSYYGYGYYGDPGYAYTGDPGYGAYAYAPGYAPSYGYGYDSGYGYNSNTTSYQRERVLEGRDY